MIESQFPIGSLILCRTNTGFPGLCVDASQCRLQIPQQILERAIHCRGSGNDHIIVPGFGEPRHNMRHSRAQSALGAVSRHRAADPPAGGITDADRRFGAIRVSLVERPAGRPNGLQDQSGHGRFVALGSGMEKLGPPRQAYDPRDHRPIPTGVCALWRGAAREYGGRRRFSYGSESRAVVYAQYCWVETFASMACLRRISGAGPKLRSGGMCLLWKKPLYTDLAGQSQCWRLYLPHVCLSLPEIAANFLCPAIWRHNHIRAK